MKRTVFIIVIIVCSTFFITFLTIDEELVKDRPLQQVYEAALLAVILGIIGVIASKYYGDVTANDTIRELTKVLSELERKIQNLESRFDELQNSLK
ncbi:MAG TPA: hypothetical protein VEJ68_02555 [Candidatus Bathyarchaeia archaeon]|nr:hypothetical protein [Candidatus Bathyarchaeia archaeon]